MTNLEAACKTIAEAFTPAQAEGALLTAWSRLRWSELDIRVDSKTGPLAPLEPLFSHLCGDPRGRLWRLLERRARS